MPEELVDAYLAARNAVVTAGYLPEIRWQCTRDFASLSESDLLREYAWVVLAAGMKESVIRAKFPQLSAAFLDWYSASAIAEDWQACRSRGLAVFGHKGKIDAIVTFVAMVAASGFPSIKDRVANEGVRFIDSLPYMGPATSLHFAKNLGMDCAKPDRHLCRLAEASGFGEAHRLCAAIGTYVADSVAVIDVVLWRYATLDPRYVHLFAPGGRTPQPGGSRDGSMVA